MKKVRKQKKASVNNWQLNTWWHWIVIWIIAVLIIGAVGVWFQFHRPGVWDGESRINLVLIGGVEGNSNPVNTQVYLLSVEPTTITNLENQIVIVRLPGEVKMNVVQNYGGYQVSALYGLAVQEKDMSLLTKTLMYELGVPIDGWLLLPNGDREFDIGNDGNSKLSLANVAFDWWWSGTATSLSRSDLMRLWVQLRSVRPERIKQLDFSLGNWARSETEVDGQPVIWFDANASDLAIAHLMASNLILTEGLTLKIVNTTGRDGLGNQVARIANGMGLRVTEVSTTTESLERCKLTIGKNLETSLSVRKLISVFSCELNIQNDMESRADIEMAIGSEQSPELNN